jgi:8-oxo-dGTP diphosphatase
VLVQFGCLGPVTMTKSSRHQYCYDYPRPAVTTDMVVVTKDAKPRVLLIQRKHAPFAGRWALPGGFVNQHESLDAAARRELREETGIEVDGIEQLHTFGEPGRDPRGHVVSVVYLAQLNSAAIRPVAADDAAKVAWFPLNALPALAFDHAEILALARQRLARKRKPARSSKRRG